jgi:3-oxoacyl-[acyl-carrier protein] reductase
MMNLSLDAKTALVCGASQGIGRAIAIALADLGANCILLARNESALKEVVASLNTGKGQTHHCVVVDFTQLDTFSSTISSITAKWGIDILINNTGGPAGGLIADANPMAFELAFKQHLLCNHILAQAVTPHMKEKAWGRIINVISTSVKIPINNLGVSNTIRAAVASWAKTLSNELAVHGITVNSLLPGFISTSRLDAVAEGFAAKEGVGLSTMIQSMKNSVPAKRFGDPSEIAAVAAFVASPAASYVNGITIPVDGGRTGTI